MDSENSSLNAVAKLINKNEDSGLRASVINDGSGSESPWRLILSLKETGDGKKAEFPYFYFVDGEDDFFLEFEREAQDAKIAMDGFEIELPENSTSDLIPGVTIDLKKAKPGEEFSISITEDSGAISEKVKTMIDQLNSVLKFVKDQNTMDETTDTSRTLGGDIILQTIEGRIRSAVFKDVKTEKGNFRIGDIFTGELEKSYQKVSQILNGSFKDGIKTNGFIDNLNDSMGSMLRYPDGLLQSRKRSVENNIAAIDRRITQRERMLEQKEKNLKDKFARLEGQI